MSIECSECERDAHGPHDLDCSRHPMRVVEQERDKALETLQKSQEFVARLLSEREELRAEIARLKAGNQP